MSTGVRGWLLAACAGLALAASPAGGSAGAASGRDAARADPTRAQAKLDAVRARIQEVTRRLSGELAARDAEAARVRAAELAVTDARRRLEAVRTDRGAAERHAAQLRAEHERAQRALAAEHAELASTVRIAYMNGPAEPLKLLLEQDSPAATGRMLAYYGYLARERAARVRDVDAQVTRVQALLQEIDAQTQRLQSLEADAKREAGALERARAERKTALAALDARVAGGHRELADLKRQEQAVESLIAELARAAQDFPVDSEQPFGELRGRLPWPAAGRVVARFSQPRGDAQSGLRWNGVLIEAPRGTRVRAPYFGRVVYADWLQGLGLLLIVAHGHDYLTLYGHAEVLYKSVGDWVSPGDVIAALPDGGEAAPRLYFEIRAGRKPVDPLSWLKPAS